MERALRCDRRWMFLAAAAGLTSALVTLPRAAAAADQQTAEGSFAIVDVILFDGVAFSRNQDVWVENGRVLSVGAGIEMPEDLPRVDGRGHTLLPGLIDAHVHSFPGALGDALRFGVTSVLDQFTDPSFMAAQRGARDEIGRTAAADLFSAGMLATAAGGHGTQFGTPVEAVAGPDEAARWVRARVDEGSDWIKIVSEDGSAFGREIPALGGATIGALIGAAHAEGLLAVVHAGTFQRAMEAVALGADGLVHVWMDALIAEEEARRLAEAEVFVVPTMSVLASMFGDSTGLRVLEATPDSMVSPIQQGGMADQSYMRTGTGGETALENVRRLHAAGVRILAGTDAPNPGTAHGISMHGEIRLLAAAGMESAEVLAAATSLAAGAFGIPERGRIAEGHIADFVLVRGDAEADVTRTADIVTIWKDGYPVARAAARAVAAAAAAPAAERVLVDFEGGIDSGFGSGWQATTDGMAGGSSTASLDVEDGALVVHGETVAGALFPWAGALWFPGSQPMEAVDFAGREMLTFRTRGDGRDYTVMLFGAVPVGTLPATVPFVAGPEWSVVEIPLNRFDADDPTVISGLAFVAQTPLGSFAFELDDVEIR